jgi:type IV secretory pathway VirB4 component
MANSFLAQFKSDSLKMLRQYGIKDGLHGFFQQEATSFNSASLFPAPRVNQFDRGVIMGINRLPNTAFQLSLWDYYNVAGITSYSMVVFGKIGQRKSTFVKTYALRHSFLGIPLYVLDPKGEYEAFARALNLAYVDPRSEAINPFVRVPGNDANETLNQRVAVLTALLNIFTDTPLPSFTQHIIRGMCANVSSLDAPILDDFIHLASSGNFQLSADIDPGAMYALLPNIQHLLVLMRDELGDVLNRHYSARSLEDLSSAGIVVNLSPWLTNKKHLAALLTATTEWLTPRLHTVGERKILILDEAWSALEYEPFVAWLQAQLKLARQWTLSTILVAHAPDDLVSQAQSASRAEKIAASLPGNFAGKVVFHLDSHAVHPLIDWGMPEFATDWIANPQTLTPGSAFVQLGPLWGILDTVVTPYELRITDTDASLAASRAQAVGGS